jgi:hypothetical protein
MYDPTTKMLMQIDKEDNLEIAGGDVKTVNIEEEAVLTQEEREMGDTQMIQHARKGAQLENEMGGEEAMTWEERRTSGLAEGTT